MENINLIRKIAWSFSTTTGVEFDDLFQEAALAYLKALDSYDPDKGYLSTYVWNRISTRLKEYLKEQEEFKCRRQQVSSHQEALKTKRRYYSTEVIDIDKPVSFTPFFESLSKDAQEVAKVVLETPELFDSIPAEEAKERVSKILQEKGVRLSQIWSGIKDLSLALA